MRPFDQSLPMALLRAREAVMRGFRRLLREHGLNEQEWRIMRALMEADQLDIGELAEHVFILKPSATRTVKNLEARGVVVRSRPPSDQRRSLISLTAKGRTLFDELAPHSEQEYARITGLIGDLDTDQLYLLLRRVTDALNGG
jgi:homoprotocatechuate degradation regulator HpaR